MFGLFNKKSKVEILQEKYQKLLQQSFEISTTNRSEADKKYAEAQEILSQIDVLLSGSQVD